MRARMSDRLSAKECDDVDDVARARRSALRGGVENNDDGLGGGYVPGARRGGGRGGGKTRFMTIEDEGSRTKDWEINCKSEMKHWECCSMGALKRRQRYRRRFQGSTASRLG